LPLPKLKVPNWAVSGLGKAGGYMKFGPKGNYMLKNNGDGTFTLSNANFNFFDRHIIGATNRSDIELYGRNTFPLNNKNSNISRESNMGVGIIINRQKDLDRIMDVFGKGKYTSQEARNWHYQKMLEHFGIFKYGGKIYRNLDNYLTDFLINNK
jgi:hypothetical protein